MSTDLTVDAGREPVGVTGPSADDARLQPLDLDAAWRLSSQVSIRPERFGALLYHFGTRRLSFLKSPTLLAVVRALADSASAREACLSVGVREDELPTYRAALTTLAHSQMIGASS